MAGSGLPTYEGHGQNDISLTASEKTARDPEVIATVGGLDAEVERLEQQLYRLNDRLVQVSRPAAPTVQEATMPPEFSTPLSDRLGSLASRVGAVTDSLIGAIERLEV